MEDNLEMKELTNEEYLMRWVQMGVVHVSTAIEYLTGKITWGEVIDSIKNKIEKDASIK